MSGRHVPILSRIAGSTEDISPAAFAPGMPATEPRRPPAPRRTSLPMSGRADRHRTDGTERARRHEEDRRPTASRVRYLLGSSVGALGKVQVARAQSLEVDRHVAVAAGPHGGDN